MGVTWLVGGAVQAAPPTVISQAMIPYTIGQPGHYVLAGPLHYSGEETAIRITTGNVDLNGAGYTLSGPDFDRAKGISVGAVSGVRIHNVNVTTFQVGILLDGASGVAVNGNTVSHSLMGIAVNSGSNNTVLGNTVSQIDYFGIRVEGSSHVVTGNTVDHVDGDGIRVEGSNHVVTGNTADRNDAGIRLVTGTGNVVRGNAVRFNGVAGIAANLGTVGNRIQGNTAASNAVDLRDFNGNCSANGWQGNLFGTANPSCIR